MRFRWCAFDDLSPRELYDVLALRQQVFVVEQACPYQDADGRDTSAMHLLGLLDDGLGGYLRAFGPGVVYEEASIGRVVTSPRIRGTGGGTALMREGLARVRATWGPVPVRISAQAHLAPWYTTLGFEVVGPGYLEDDIPHLPMRFATGR